MKEKTNISKWWCFRHFSHFLFRYLLLHKTYEGKSFLFFFIFQTWIIIQNSLKLNKLILQFLPFAHDFLSFLLQRCSTVFTVHSNHKDFTSPQCWQSNCFNNFFKCEWFLFRFCRLNVQLKIIVNLLIWNLVWQIEYGVRDLNQIKNEETTIELNDIKKKMSLRWHFIFSEKINT